MAFASSATAQLSNYLGPGILTNGAGDIGSRSGEQVDLRYYVNLNGIYDNGIQPVSVDSKGNLVQVGGLYGVDLALGAYGSHSWRTALLGVDYQGDFRHYAANSFYDGTNQNLSIGYTYQKSRRLYFDLKGTFGTYSAYLGGAVDEGAATPGAINQPSLLLFDNRTDFLQGTAGMTYLLSARASVSISGAGFYVDRQSSALIGVDGYNAQAKFQYKLSRTTSVGAGYTRSHYQYPNFFGNSNMNNYSVFLATQLGRLWTLSVSGGAYQVTVVGLQSVAIDPAIAALLGVSSAEHTFQAINWIPAAQSSLIRKFKTSSLSFAYTRSAVPGNGVYLTSRSEAASASFSYTGVHRAAFTISGGYTSLASLGQGLPPYSSYGGSTGLTYNLTHALHAVARYDVRQQEIDIADYRRTSYRVTLGIAFSPGTLPLSLW